MPPRILITLSLGLLGGCALYLDDGREPVEPGEPTDPGTPAEPPSPGQQAKALLAEWSGCLTLEAFATTNMAPSWSAVAPAGGGACTSCHVAASPSFPISSDPGAFFRAVSEHSHAMLEFFAIDLTSPAQVIENPRPFANIAAGKVPYDAHPRFDVTGAMPALTKLTAVTAARRSAGTCDPPRLVD